MFVLKAKILRVTAVGREAPSTKGQTCLTQTTLTTGTGQPRWLTGPVQVYTLKSLNPEASTTQESCIPALTPELTVSLMPSGTVSYSNSVFSLENQALDWKNKFYC